MTVTTELVSLGGIVADTLLVLDIDGWKGQCDIKLVVYCSGYLRMLLLIVDLLLIVELVPEFKSHVSRTFGFTHKKKKTRLNCWNLLAAWVGAIRCKSTREERAEVFSTGKNEGTCRSGEGEKEPSYLP